MQPLFSLSWLKMEKHTFESMRSILFLDYMLTELNDRFLRHRTNAFTLQCLMAKFTQTSSLISLIYSQQLSYTGMYVRAQLLMLKLRLFFGDPNVLVVIYLQTMPLMLLSVIPLSIQTSSFFYKF